MADYWDVRYFGNVHIRNEQTQQREAEHKAKQQARAAAHRADRAAADALPLRATLVGDSPVRLVISDSRTGQDVAQIPTKNHTREFLTTSYVTYLLEACGWTLARYHRRSKTNPAAYWTVTRAEQADPVDGTPATVDHQNEDGQTVQPAPGHTLPACTSNAEERTEGHRHDADADAADEVAAPVEVDAVHWSDLDPDHWAARWEHATETMPVDDPARIWSRAAATLAALGYRHERHDRPGHVHPARRLVTTDARADVADEAAELSRRAAAVLDAINTQIRATHPQAQPIALDGTGPSGTPCDTGCGALAHWSIPTPHAESRRRYGLCRSCLLDAARPATLAPATTTDRGQVEDYAEPVSMVRPLALFKLRADVVAADTPTSTGSLAMYEIRADIRTADEPRTASRARRCRPGR